MPFWSVQPARGCSFCVVDVARRTSCPRTSSASGGSARRTCRWCVEVVVGDRRQPAGSRRRRRPRRSTAGSRRSARPTWSARSYFVRRLARSYVQRTGLPFGVRAEGQVAAAVVLVRRGEDVRARSAGRSPASRSCGSARRSRTRSRRSRSDPTPGPRVSEIRVALPFASSVKVCEFPTASVTVVRRPAVS